MTRFFGLFAFACLIMAAVPAFSAEVPNHPELQKFVKDGGRIDFLGNAYGLDGWMLTKDEMEPRTVYTTPEGGVVMGVLIGPDGTVETTNQMAALKDRLQGGQAAVPGADKGLPADTVAEAARTLGIPAASRGNIDEALDAVRKLDLDPPPRILITGSLYLAGDVLRENGTPPS